MRRQCFYESQIEWDIVGPHDFSGRFRLAKKKDSDGSVKSVKSVKPVKPLSISRLAKKKCLDKSVKSVKVLPISLPVKKFG